MLLSLLARLEAADVAVLNPEYAAMQPDAGLSGRGMLMASFSSCRSCGNSTSFLVFSILA